MKKLSPLIILSLLLLSGCGVFGGGGDDDQANTTPNPPPQPAPEGQNTNDTDLQQGTTNTETNTTPNALIPSTNPKERLNQITQGRGDPFGSIRPPAVIRIPATQPVPESATAKAILREPLRTPSETEISKNSTGKLAANSGNVTSPNGTQGSKNQGQLNADGQTIDDNGNIIPYTPPEPKEAKSVIVSGIADLQGQNVAFITTPWDNMTHRVTVGDTLFSQDSRVIIRVKDIRFTEPKTIALRDNDQVIYQRLYDSNGVVTLEQYGQKVTRKIVGNPETPTKSNS